MSQEQIASTIVIQILLYEKAVIKTKRTERFIYSGSRLNNALHISPDEIRINGISFDNHWV